MGAAAEEEGVAGGDRVTGRAPALLRASLTRGTLFGQLGIFLVLIRGIFKLVFYKCSVCTGGTCWVPEPARVNSDFDCPGCSCREVVNSAYGNRRVLG